MPVAPARKPAGVKKGFAPSTGTLQCGAGVLIIAIIIGASQYFSPPSEEQAAAAKKMPSPKTIAKAVSPLTDENFAEYVATMHPGGALIDFYSQSCKFCTKLAPEFEKAAYLSTQEEGGPPFASVDQETGRVIMETFGIERFPTVLWFWKGKNVMELPRASEKPAAEILKWAKWAATPAVQELETNEELEGALPTLRTSMHKNARLIVAFNLGEGSESMRGSFEEAAQRHRATTVFLCIKEAVTDKKPIMSYAAEDSKDEFYEGAANVTEVVQWVKTTLESAKPPKEEEPEKESSTQKALNALKGTVASEAEE